MRDFFKKGNFLFTLWIESGTLTLIEVMFIMSKNLLLCSGKTSCELNQIKIFS